MQWMNENWPVPHQYHVIWDETKYTHRVQPVIAFNTNGDIIPPKPLNVKLKGVLCEVWFRVKHYYLKS